MIKAQQGNTAQGTIRHEDSGTIPGTIPTSERCKKGINNNEYN